MIGHFPTPLPDELLYSLCARYYDRVRYSKSGTTIELFGGINSVVAVALPRHLGHLATALPPHHSFTVDRMIDKHTLFPFYQPFLNKESIRRVRMGMAGSDRSGIPNITSIVGRGSFEIQDWLRFCPICLEEDRSKFREGYWHRLHQAPGVEVCPKHNLFLENSNARARLQANADWYVRAEQAASAPSQRRLNLMDPFHQYLKRWACDVAWLLKQNNISLGNERLLDVYLRLLAEKGLISRTGRKIRIKEIALVEALNNYLPQSFLNLYAPNQEVKSYRPYDSILKLLRGLSAYALHHLILIQFLGHTAKSFFKMVAKDGFSHNSRLLKPFGNSPWPCLNPAAPHVRKRIINNCLVIKSRMYSDLLVGSFACPSCGFTYTRTGPDQSSNDRFRFETISSYGPVWEAALKELWGDSSLAVIRIAARLGVRASTINRQATFLGLPFPRQGPGSWVTHVNPKATIKMVRRQAEHEKRRKTYRKMWLSAQKKQPGITTRELAHKFRAAYIWLTRHDREWLDEHKPPRSNRRQPYKSKLIGQDSKIAEDVRREAIRLKNLDGRPVRVTRAMIARNLNRGKLGKGRTLENLPLTTKAFNEVVDSRLEFITRRYKWSARRLIQEGKCLSKSAIIKGSILGQWPDPQTAAIAETVLQNLQESEVPQALEVA